MGRPAIPCPPKPCEHCGKDIPRRRHGKRQILEWHVTYSQRRYCSAECRDAAAMKTVPVRHCAVCGKPFQRNRYSNGSLESIAQYSKRQACSGCIKLGYTRHLTRPPIVLKPLTDQEFIQISEYLAIEDPDSRLKRKAQMVLMSSQGMIPIEIAQQLGVDDETVRRWIKRFQTEGIEGLRRRKWHEGEQKAS